MIHTIALRPGITLRCFPDNRFKQSCLSLQFVRPMRGEEASLNALLPAVLLRGTKKRPDLRAIVLRLDDLYGASVGTQVRRVGDYQTTGMYCSFIEDRYALDGDAVLQPMVEFLEELLLEPVLEDGVFSRDFVESEKKNLTATIEAQRNDKRAWASAQLLRTMCREDSFGIPRLGYAGDVTKITAQSLYDHYRRVLRESPVELFYAGSGEPEAVAAMLKPLFAKIERNYVNLPAQTSFHDAGGKDVTERMEVAQGKLCMGFVTDITLRDPRFVAMQLCNTILGAGMISKLFVQIREKLSLCYDISSGYHGTKGILTVAAGIDCDKDELVRAQVLEQLNACVRGEITQQELIAGKEALYSSLRGTHDSAGAIESYYSTAVLSGLGMTPEEYMRAAEKIQVADVAAAAATLKLHSVYFLKGVQ